MSELDEMLHKQEFRKEPQFAITFTVTVRMQSPVSITSSLIIVQALHSLGQQCNIITAITSVKKPLHHLTITSQQILS